LAPNHLVLLNARANTLLDLNRPEDAVAAYESILARVPWDVVAANGRAEALRRLGRVTEALDAYRQNCEAHPDNAYSINGYANMLLTANQAEQALLTYDDALNRWPWNSVAASGRGETLRALGRLDDSLIAFDSALERQPLKAHLRNGRGFTLLAMGRREEALAEFEEVIAVAPWEVHALRGRAAALRTLHRVAEAIELLDLIIAANRNDIQARHDRATALKSARRFEEAIAEYQSMATDFPHDRLAPARLASLRLVRDPGTTRPARVPASQPASTDADWTRLIVEKVDEIRRRNPIAVREVELPVTPVAEYRALLELVVAVSDLKENAARPGFNLMTQWPTRTCDVTEAIQMHINWQSQPHDPELAAVFASVLGIEVSELNPERIQARELELVMLAA
jgi:tetratricopeptide (TPR) repeat protein